MSAIKMRVLPLLPAQIVGIEPIFVSKQGNVYEISLDNGPQDVIAMSQVIQQLSAMNLYDTVYAAIPGELNNPVRIAFNGSGNTQLGSLGFPGPVIKFISDMFGWTIPQLSTFISSAQLLTFQEFQ